MTSIPRMFSSEEISCSKSSVVDLEQDLFQLVTSILIALSQMTKHGRLSPNSSPRTFIYRPGLPDPCVDVPIFCVDRALFRGSSTWHLKPGILRFTTGSRLTDCLHKLFLIKVIKYINNNGNI